MNWVDFQVTDFSKLLDSEFSESESMASSLLDWVVNTSAFKAEIYEDNLNITGQVYYRFYIKGTISENQRLSGFGRSKNRLTAASIAVGELIERYVAKSVFADLSVKSNAHIQASSGLIDIETSSQQTDLPKKSFHSSNGWSVHFNAKKAIENSFLEALERHTLLYTFLKDGWSGFIKDQTVPFNKLNLTPNISKHSFGGYTAGIVVTQGPEFSGRTFGYLCDSVENINSSKKWLSAFFESHDQWELLTKEARSKQDSNILHQYQNHFLHTEFIDEQRNEIEPINIDEIKGNLVLFDVQNALDLPCPFFAAFSYGEDLIPLLFRQKISEADLAELNLLLSKWSLPLDLPEYHPIL